MATQSQRKPAIHRVLVTGSRDFDDYGIVCIEIGRLLQRQIAVHRRDRIIIVHGAARGADSLAERAARAFGMAVEAHPADWAAHGKRAGHIRNAEMVAAGADLCLAFYAMGALNRGTAHCVKLAEQAGIPVRRITDG